MLTLSQYPYLVILQKLARQKKQDVFFIGGFLRDALLGVEGHDFDFALAKFIDFQRLLPKKSKAPLCF